MLYHIEDNYTRSTSGIGVGIACDEFALWLYLDDFLSWTTPTEDSPDGSATMAMRLASE